MVSMRCTNLEHCTPAPGQSERPLTPLMSALTSSGHNTHCLLSESCRFCCKSLFALVIKNFPGFRRDFGAKMWGTSSPNDKLADDPGNAIEGTRISGRGSDFLTAGKLAPGNLGLLQQNLPRPDVSRCSKIRHGKQLLDDLVGQCRAASAAQ
jgi:hypothetical protein